MIEAAATPLPGLKRLPPKAQPAAKAQPAGMPPPWHHWRTNPEVMENIAQAYDEAARNPDTTEAQVGEILTKLEKVEHALEIRYDSHQGVFFAN